MELASYKTEWMAFVHFKWINDFKNFDRQKMFWDVS